MYIVCRIKVTSLPLNVHRIPSQVRRAQIVRSEIYCVQPTYNRRKIDVQIRTTYVHPYLHPRVQLSYNILKSRLTIDNQPVYNWHTIGVQPGVHRGVPAMHITWRLFWTRYRTSHCQHVVPLSPSHLTDYITDSNTTYDNAVSTSLFLFQVHFTVVTLVELIDLIN